MSTSAAFASPSAHCDVCPHACVIPDGKLGVCGARGARDGAVESCNFGRATALALDPIEKKPLARYKPGTKILSYGSFGCNQRCAFCQNAGISTASATSGVRTQTLLPEALVSAAEAARARGNIGVALTYNEPLIAPEFLCAVGERLKERDLDLVVVTNGYATAATIDKVAPYIDAANIDLKCFSEEGYKRLGAPRGLETVMHTIAAFVDAGIHVEVTTLVVPGLSDDPALFDAECAWLASLSPHIPLHLSRFFPSHKMTDARPTDVELLKTMQAQAAHYLTHVYLGNVR